MARALLGHLPTAADHHLVAENARLRRRVADLEALVVELRAQSVEIADDAELHAELHAMTLDHQTEPV